MAVSGEQGSKVRPGLFHKRCLPFLGLCKERIKISHKWSITITKRYDVDTQILLQRKKEGSTCKSVDWR